MKTYSIVAPDGKTVSIQGPEGADTEEVKQRLMAGWRKQFPVTATGPAATQKAVLDELAAKDPSTAQRFLAGVRSRHDEMAYGLKDLFTDLTPQEKDELETGRAVRNASLPAAIGAGTLDAAIMALPATRLAALKGLPTAARIAIPTAVGATTGATLTPDNRTRAAIAGGAGMALPAGMGIASQRLKDAGVTLPNALKAVKEFAKEHPVLASSLGSGGSFIGAENLTNPLFLTGAKTATGLLGGPYLYGEAARLAPGVVGGATYGTFEELSR